MSRLCDPYPLAQPLNYCASVSTSAGEEPGTLHIGVLPADREADTLAVLLTNLATGRTQIAGLIGDDLDVVAIQQPTDLSPGTVYEVVVIALTDVMGINPIPFFPYLYESAGYITAYSTVDGVNVKFIKIFDGLDVHSHAEQFICIQ